VSVVVGHAQDADRELSEGFGAYPVALAPGRVIVDAAVELEDEALRRAMEVDDEAGDTRRSRRATRGSPCRTTRVAAATSPR
jgi:hypothetical protein